MNSAGMRDVARQKRCPTIQRKAPPDSAAVGAHTQDRGQPLLSPDAALCPVPRRIQKRVWQMTGEAVSDGESWRGTVSDLPQLDGTPRLRFVRFAQTCAGRGRRLASLASTTTQSLLGSVPPAGLSSLQDDTGRRGLARRVLDDRRRSIDARRAATRDQSLSFSSSEPGRVVQPSSPCFSLLPYLLCLLLLEATPQRTL